jgi:hypothetical protein
LVPSPSFAGIYLFTLCFSLASRLKYEVDAFESVFTAKPILLRGIHINQPLPPYLCFVDAGYYPSLCFFCSAVVYVYIGEIDILGAGS